VVIILHKLRSRQVHLDFHTSELMLDVGQGFSKENFQKALQIGNVNSITLFAKCHHSWCYYPSNVGKMHPNLEFDLLGEQIKVAHGIGVKAPIYITVGWSSNDADNNPQWLARNKDKSIQVTNYDFNAKPTDKKPIVSWKILCPNESYANHIYKLTEEVCDRYEVVDGLFYDICFINKVCYCDDCIDKMTAMGLNPDSEEDANNYYTYMRIEFMKRCTEILHKKHPQGTIFFNCAASMYEPQWHPYQTHYEMEDLPTTWGGYDIMPPRAKFFARTGKDYLGMTGKFHTMWGEFGGFKNPSALKYECSAMLAYGARCSVGDQCHPSGEMDLETYRIIGEAYEYAKQIEDYCFDVKETSKLGIMLADNLDNETIDVALNPSDGGLINMLLETQYDFDIVLLNDDFSRFDVIVLPDNILLDEVTAKKLDLFVKSGGGLLLTGDSGLNKDKSKFLADIGMEYIGKSNYDIDYVKPLGEMAKGIVSSPFLFYSSANIVKAKNGEVLSQVYTPYFNRTYGEYCSHQNTPNKLKPESYPAALKRGRVIYIAHHICKMYKEVGAQYHRDYLINALKLIYDKPVAGVKMPSGGRMRFVKQEAKSRYVLHLLYGQPIQRGSTSVIEDFPKLYDIPVSLSVSEKIKRIKMMPQNEDILFVSNDKSIEFVVPSIRSHQLIVLEY